MFNSVITLVLALTFLSLNFVMQPSVSCKLFLDIPNFNCFPKSFSASTHGGLATYVNNDLHVHTIDIPSHSETVWESQFLVISGAATGN